MKNFKFIFVILFFVTACGGGSDNKETQFYKKEQTIPQKLEVSIAQLFLKINL